MTEIVRGNEMWVRSKAIGRSSISSQPAVAGPYEGSDGYSTRVESYSPVAYWRLHGAGSNAVLDFTTNNHDLTATGSITFESTGAIANTEDECIYIGGGSGIYLDAPYAAALNPASFTISAWVNRDSAAGGLDYIIGARSGGGGGDGFAIYSNSDSTISATLYHTGGSGNTITGSALSRDAWHHIALTYNGTNAELFYNGTSEAGPTALSYDQNTDTATRIGNALSPTIFTWRGSLDEIAIFDTVLSGAAITDLANGTA